MKLTKSKLKQIIKEELGSALKEDVDGEPKTKKHRIKWFGLFDEIHKGLTVLAEGLDKINERVAKLEKDASSEIN